MKDQDQLLFNEFIVNTLENNKNLVNGMDFHSAFEEIAKALRAYGGPIRDFSNCKYVNILYPPEAMNILALSRSDKWPGFEVDTILLRVLSEWFHKDHGEFINQTFHALDDLKCVEGLLLRLNLDILLPTTTDTIRIKTAIKTVTLQKNEQVFTITQRAQIKQILLTNRQYISNRDTVYSKLAQLHNSYFIEQAMVSWIGYLVTKVLIKNGQFRKRLALKPV